MKWPSFPFVSRGIYEDSQENLRMAQVDIRELTRVIINLKISGATLTQRPIIQGAAPAKPVDLVQAAINRKPASARPAVRKGFNDFADRLRNEGRTEKHIADEIDAYGKLEGVGEKDDDEDTIAITTEVPD